MGNNVSLSCPPEIQEFIKEMAHQQRISFSQYVIDLVKEKRLEHSKNQPVPSKTDSSNAIDKDDPDRIPPIPEFLCSNKDITEFIDTIENRVFLSRVEGWCRFTEKAARARDQVLRMKPYTTKSKFVLSSKEGEAQ